MKNENVMLSIIGTQIVDGEKDKIEVKTQGKCTERDGKVFLEYKEYDRDYPEKYISNLVKIEEDKQITIIRSGESGSRLVLEKGKRHQCHYNTLGGSLCVGVFTENIKSTLSEQGGDLWVKYTLDFNTDLVSQNEFEINVKRLTV